MDHPAPTSLLSDGKYVTAWIHFSSERAGHAPAAHPIQTSLCDEELKGGADACERLEGQRAMVRSDIAEQFNDVAKDELRAITQVLPT